VKQFWVFQYAILDARGGMGDFVDSYDTTDQAERAVRDLKPGPWHLCHSHFVDAETGKIISYEFKEGVDGVGNWEIA
jgi:hypothetical protein